MTERQRIWPWLLVWGLLDLLCALFCEIHADEAYYRLYGQFLNWGYFDHPPMVGLMTALSAAIVPNTSLILKNLSVRLATVLMHMATVYIIWETIPQLSISNHQSPVAKFILLSASIPMFCAYGFITTPDAPLLFFAAMFYFSYRRHLSTPDPLTTNPLTPNTLLLGISMAGMMYSKYMAVLVIAFAVIGNWRLLRDKRAWVAVGIAAVLMLPHLWWQYANDFPSFTYHLVARATPYSPLYTLEFIPNQWAVFNPLVWMDYPARRCVSPLFRCDNNRFSGFLSADVVPRTCRTALDNGNQYSCNYPVNGRRDNMETWINNYLWCACRITARSSYRLNA